MKKLIFLILVVGITSASNASMVLELRHEAGDTLEIYATSAYTIGDDIYFFVFGDTSEVMVSGGTVGVKEPAGPVPKDTVVGGGVGIPEPPPPLPDPLDDAVYGWIGTTAGTTSAGVGTYILDINWSLVGGATEAEISLYGTADFVTIDELSTITVPEPMTIALLGLGGLMLLRRRR
jgi:hypothetical protein